MNSRYLWIACAVLAQGAFAQPSPFAGAERFRLDFTYSVDGGIDEDSVDVDYSMTARGEGTLIPNPPGTGYRADNYAVSVKLSYVGKAVNTDSAQQECGMRERLVNEGMPGTATVANCTAAELELNATNYSCTRSRGGEQRGG